MWDTFALFSSSYLATLAMGLVCAYLGVFCVLRRIVFTGVALAQLAAGGVAISFFVADLGLGSVSRFAATYGATWGSLGASLAGLLGLQARRREGRITEDALVGLAYSAAGALAILLVWRSSRGLTELQNILAGTVLLPQQSELVSLAIGLAAVAVVHALYRRELLLVSFDPEFARAAGLKEDRYQLLFLATLAVAVALALKAGGLMLVFAFLVVPPLAGLSLGDRLGESTLYALAIAAAGSLLGFLCSIRFDWPVGPSVALCLVLFLGVCLLGRVNEQLLGAARSATLALGALALLAGPLALLASPAPADSVISLAEAADDEYPRTSPPFHDDDDEESDNEEDHNEDWEELLNRLSNGSSAERVEVIPELVANAPEALEPLLAVVLDPDFAVRDAVDAALSVVMESAAADEEFVRLLSAPNVAPLARLHAGVAATRLGDPRGPLAIVDVLAAAQDDLPLLVQDDAVALLRQLRGGDGFGFDALEAPAANAEALGAWRSWLENPASTDAARDERQTNDILAPESSPEAVFESVAATPEELTQRLLSGPDRLGAARDLFDAGAAGGEILELVLADGPADAAHAAASALPITARVQRLDDGSLYAPIRIAVARDLLDAWRSNDAWDPAPALAELRAVANPPEADLRRVLALLPLPSARDTWQTVAARNPITASVLIADWLRSPRPEERVSAAAGIGALLQPRATFETAWNASAPGADRDRLLLVLATEAGPILSPALLMRYGEAGPETQAALLRRVGRELDADGWPLIGLGQSAANPQVRRAAREALTEFSMAQAARAEWELMQERAREAELVEILRDQLTQADPANAANAAHALADLGVRSAIPDLVAALRRDDPNLRAALRSALRQLGQLEYVGDEGY
ncbi:MAG: metal ABC transporter permease [Pseudomonadota bacterium]